MYLKKKKKTPGGIHPEEEVITMEKGPRIRPKGRAVTRRRQNLMDGWKWPLGILATLCGKKGFTCWGVL